MKVTLRKATTNSFKIIENLNAFYVYDMYKHCGSLPDWKVPDNGKFTGPDLTRYKTERDRYSFLVYVDDELAGFVLVNKIGTTIDVDWTVAEFFIVSKFQAKGIGKTTAHMIFRQFPGVWEVMQIPENTPAVAFWKHAISSFTEEFESFNAVIQEPKPHKMHVYKFLSPTTYSE